MEESYLWVSNVSSNINEVIRSVLNFFFFYDEILHTREAQKEYKAPKSTKGTKSIKKH